MNRVLLSATFALALFACGGGDDTDKPPTTPGGSTGNQMTAKLDGQAWTGSAQVQGGQAGARMGNINIIGTKLSPQVIVTLSLSYIDGPGTYPLGVNFLTNAGGTAIVSKASEFWTTPMSGAAGSVTITMRTATRIAGTFAFTAEKTVGEGAPIVVTDGEFDITKAAGLPALPTGKGSTLSADLGDAHWNAATISVEAAGEHIGGSSTDYVMGLSVNQTPVAGRSYAIGRDATVSSERADNNDSWLSATQDSVGYISISRVTSERLEGTFAGHLDPHGTASSPLVITNGSFSVHLQ